MAVKVVALENGPYQVETGGRVTVQGQQREEKAIYLCRCGGSKNKPFCDGTHREIGFQAPQAVLELGP